MLFNPVICVLFVVISLLFSPSGFCSAVDKLPENGDYVPELIRPMISPENEKQIKVLPELASFSTRYQKTAEDLRDQQQSLIQSAYDTLGKANNLFPKKRYKQLHLYYFISFSMPDALIKSYLSDAAHNGGVLVLNGVTPDLSLSQFIKQHLLALLRYKAHAKVIIDPNRFERYCIDKVPAMVVAWERQGDQGCQPAESDKQPVLLSCKPEPQDNYWKISGNVTSLWALQRMQTAGAPVGDLLRKAQ